MEPRRRLADLDHEPADRGPVGAGRWHRGAARPQRRDAQHPRPAHRAGVGQPPALPGAADGARADLRAGLRPRRNHPDASPRGLLVVLAAARAHRPPRRGLRRRGGNQSARAAVAVHLGLPGDAARHGGHAPARHGGRHLDPSLAPPAALRVLAPAAPVRLPRRRARDPAHAVDRGGLHRVARWRRRTGGGCGPWSRHPSCSSESACRWCGRCGTRCGSSASSRTDVMA